VQLESKQTPFSKDFRDGFRKNATMQTFAKNLTDKEIKNLAEYYASQKTKIMLKPPYWASMSALNRENTCPKIKQSLEISGSTSKVLSSFKKW
jgi:DNA primase catalytic subunit